MKALLYFFFFGSIFSIQAQTLNSVSPDFGAVGDYIPVTISGSNIGFSSGSSYPVFRFLQGSSYLSFPQQPTVVDSNNVSGFMDLTQQGTNTINQGFYNLRFYQGSSISTDLVDAFFVNVSLGGTNVVSATIVQGSGKMLGEGDPIIQEKIFLESESNEEVLLVGRTDANGFIKFENIPDGSYFLHIYDHDNVNPYRIEVAQGTSTTNLNIEFKDGHLISGINDRIFEEKFEFSLSPTLFSSELILNMNLKSNKNIAIHIIDLNGKVIAKIEKKLEVGKLSIDLSNHFENQSNGVYFIKTSIDGYSKVEKVIRK